ncbi:MAG TPA: hypothetical protein VEI06_13170 [Gemmatimonadaceae bacterium]|nr:hypothetical protein [Gemmatimonadaceae bacterium]
MTELSLARIRSEGDAMMQALSREYYESGAGIKSSAELQPIYARHAGIVNDDALALVREDFRQAPEGSEERRASRLLLEWEAEAHVSRALAPLDEREIAWEATAVATLDDGRQVPYQQLSIDIANAADRRERLLLERGRARLVATELAPLKREHFQREKDLVEALEIAPTYNDTFTALSGVDLIALATACRVFLRETQAMWDDVVKERVRTKLGIPLSEATRADALALLRAPEFDSAFPAESMEREIRLQASEMGIDPTAKGRIILDTGEREGKRARAFCAPVRVPEEVYLVLRPHGGQQDWRTLLHELGHSLHFGYTAGDLPFEYRWLGDNSVTEGYAMLFDHLMHDAGWLGRYTGVGAREMAVFRRALGFEELQFLRRYTAKLIYETALYGGSVSWDDLPALYVDTLSGATSFRYDPADAFVDVDPRFYSARYLRAWQLQAVLREGLRERFDSDWFRNPRAGPWVVEQLFAHGQRELGGELALRVTGQSLSFTPLVREVEAMLR